MSKPIYFKDLIGNKIGRDYNKLNALLPCMVCIEDEDGRHSYHVVGFGPEYAILSDTCYYDVEPDVGDYSCTRSYDSCIKVPFDMIDATYIFAHKPTKKQQKWLDEHDYDGDTISGYEAWHIIHDAIEAAKRRKKQREEIDYDWEDFTDNWWSEIPNF